MLLNLCSTLSKHQSGWEKKKQTDFHKIDSCVPKVHFWQEPVIHVKSCVDQARIFFVCEMLTENSP